jgi:hypothetical protein
MKHIFSVFSIVCVASFTMLLSTMNSSCKKGDDGAKGDTGTANVIYSPWLDVTFTGGSDTTFWEAAISAPKLTKAILDSGMVKVYVNLGSSTAPLIFPLPLSDVYAALGIAQLGVYFQLNSIGMYSDANLTTQITGGSHVPQFRYIIIPGGVPSGRSAVNWNDYNAVKRLYNISD